MLRPVLLAALLLGSPACAATPPAYPASPPDRQLPAYDWPAPRPADPLGQVWEMAEIAEWRGVWIRRGVSNVFDAYWSHPNGERVLAPIEVHLDGRHVVVLRRHAGERSCRYDGQFAADWREIQGRYTCTWETTPMPWSARVIHIGEVTPALLRGY